MADQAHVETQALTLGVIPVGEGALSSPGTMGAAETFPCPVVYKTIPPIRFNDLDAAEHKRAVGSFMEAVAFLEAAGCSAVVSNCSYSILFQEEVARAANIRVALSSLSLLPEMFARASSSASVGLLTSDARNFSSAYALAADPDLPLARLQIIGGNEIPAAQSFLTEGVLDYGGLPGGIMHRLETLQKSEDAIEVLLIACPGFLPFVEYIRANSDFEVHDVLTLSQQLLSGAFAQPSDAPIAQAAAISAAGSAA